MFDGDDKLPLQFSHDNSFLQEIWVNTPISKTRTVNFSIGFMIERLTC